MGEALDVRVLTVRVCCQTGEVLTVNCTEGSLFLINTSLLLHHTSIPPYQPLSLSYAREFDLHPPSAWAHKHTHPMCFPVARSPENRTAQSLSQKDASQLQLATASTRAGLAYHAGNVGYYAGNVVMIRCVQAVHLFPTTRNPKPRFVRNP